MSRRVLTVDRYKEIERLLAAGRGREEAYSAHSCRYDGMPLYWHACTLAS